MADWNELNITLAIATRNSLSAPLGHLALGTLITEGDLPARLIDLEELIL